MDKLKLDKDNLKKFGITLGIAFLVIAFFILIKRRHSVLPSSIISAIFFILAFTGPGLLKPVYIIWMRAAFMLSWLNTRLILLVIFYLVFTPLGLIMKMFKTDLLDRRIDEARESYWRKKEKTEPGTGGFERQF